MEQSDDSEHHERQDRGRHGMAREDDEETMKTRRVNEEEYD
jgi:hypothetical protein